MLGLPFTASSGSDIISETRIPVAYRSVIKQILRALNFCFLLLFRPLLKVALLSLKLLTEEAFLIYLGLRSEALD